MKIKTTKKIDNKVNDVRIWSNIVLCFELFLALIGLKYVVKANLALLVLILVTIVMFFIGSFYQTSKDSDGDTVIYGIKGWGNGNLAENMTSDYVDGYGFWSVLSIFFPAVTGVFFLSLILFCQSYNITTASKKNTTYKTHTHTHNL